MPIKDIPLLVMNGRTYVVLWPCHFRGTVLSVDFASFSVLFCPSRVFETADSHVSCLTRVHWLPYSENNQQSMPFPTSPELRWSRPADCISWPRSKISQD